MEAEGVRPGTKIVAYLKSDCREFSDEGTIKGECIVYVYGFVIVL